MKDELMEVQLATSEREFVKVYKDFLNTELLSAEEKLVFIALKSFITYGSDSGQVYPSLETLCKLSSMSETRAIRTIKKLTDKGIVTKKRRGLTKTNLYTLSDNTAMWESKNIEQLKDAAESSIDMSTQDLIAELKRRGVVVIETKKEPSTGTDQSTEEDLSKNHNKTTNNSKLDGSNCQDVRYTLDQIKTFFDYNIIIERNPDLEQTVDAIMDIIYDALNTTKQTIRVSGESKPTLVVVSKLMKLNYEEVIYVANKYNQQTEKIEYPTSYVMTLLYHAKEQYHLEISNQVNRDMFGSS